MQLPCGCTRDRLSRTAHAIRIEATGQTVAQPPLLVTADVYDCPDDSRSSRQRPLEGIDCQVEVALGGVPGLHVTTDVEAHDEVPLLQPDPRLDVLSDTLLLSVP